MTDKNARGDKYCVPGTFDSQNNLNPFWIGGHSTVDVESAVQLDQTAIANSAIAAYRAQTGDNSAFNVEYNTDLKFHYNIEGAELSGANMVQFIAD